MTEEMYWFIIRVLRGRIKRCDNNNGRSAYQSVLSMLEYAHADNLECLRQFDYYNEGEPWLKESNE